MKPTYILLICLLGLCTSKNLRLTEDNDVLNNFANSTFWINQIYSLINDAKQFLSKIDATTIKGYAKYFGSEYLNNNVQTKSTEGIGYKAWEQYKKYLMKINSIPATLQKYLEGDDRLNTDLTLHETEFYYDSTKDGKKYLKMLILMYSVTDNDNVDSLSSAIEVSFELASDVMYLTKSQVTFGDNWKISEEYFEKPRGMLENDFINLIYIIKMMGYSNLGKEIGINVDITDLLKKLDIN